MNSRTVPSLKFNNNQILNGWKTLHETAHLASGPWKKKFERLIFPTKYSSSPKSLSRLACLAKWD